jgi:glucokinase
VNAILQSQKLRSQDVDGMSFAFPGPFDYAAGISHLTHKFVSLNGKSLRAAISAHFDLEPSRIQFVNDADAFLLGELSQPPSARGGKTVGITLGTGVGSAFAVDGDIVRSGDGVPPNGEIWNLPWDGGIVEDAISTRGIQSEYERRTKERPTVREIAQRCPADQDAIAVFERFGETLGDVLRQVTAAFNPATIIFGGAISRSAELFLRVAERRVSESTTLKVSTLFEDAALLGAAAHWTRAELQTGKR